MCFLQTLPPENQVPTTNLHAILTWKRKMKTFKTPYYVCVIYGDLTIPDPNLNNPYPIPRMPGIKRGFKLKDVGIPLLLKYNMNRNQLLGGL